ncbi:hypothetical protein BDZ45DRAFT_803975 [Acephala macrosclerotiorum]|nr:hypothetical protein BDZ45DRAFT_803975 [Acephala macrosclerotiorum]
MIWYTFLTLSLILSCFPFTRRADPAASTLYTDEARATSSINLPQNSSDVYLYFLPPSYSWAVIGTGSVMEKSLMLLMYSAAGDQRKPSAALYACAYSILESVVTDSMQTGKSEPSFTTGVQIGALGSSTIDDDMIVLNGLCRGCRSLNPSIYALGPKYVLLSSDSKSIGLRRHYSFGHFTMDLKKATGIGGVPIAPNISSGAAMAGSPVQDRDKASKAHDVVMVFVTLIMIPLNVIIVGLFR